MTGRVLLMSSFPDPQEPLVAMLRSRGYEPWEATDLRSARAAARWGPFLAALVRIGEDEGDAAGAIVAGLSTDPLFSRCGIVVVADDVTAGLRAFLLGRGALDVVPFPADLRFLGARLRALGRPRSVADELALREETTRALGLADQPEYRSTVPGRIAVHAADPDAALRFIERQRQHMSDRLTLASPGDAEEAEVAVLLLDDEDETDRIADLRARLRDTRLLALLPDGRGAAAAGALDLGADDVAGIDDEPDELAHRLRKLVIQAQDRARCRSRLAEGLISAHRDDLTGLWNRRYAEPHLSRLAEAACASGRPLAVIMLDLDRFKSVNDRFGHPAGDTVLREIASRLSGSLRLADLLARVGGEEFLVALSDTRPAEARAVAGRLCAAVAAQPVILADGTRISLTVSAGLAHMGHRREGAAVDAGQLIAAADRALYASKSGGRARLTEDA